MNGVEHNTGGIQYGGNMDGSRYHTLCLVIHNSSAHYVKVFLDDVKMGTLQEHFIQAFSNMKEICMFFDSKHNI